MIGKFTRTRVLLSAGLLAGLVWTGTLAAFTDTAETTGTFSTGTVDITVTDEGATWLTVEDMAPGHVEYASLQVTNAGSLDFEYGMDSAVDDGDADLAAALDGVVSAQDQADCNADDFDGAGAFASGSLTGLSSGATERALAEGGSEWLCFEITFDDEADNDLQDSSVDVLFTFTATQS